MLHCISVTSGTIMLYALKRNVEDAAFKTWKSFSIFVKTNLLFFSLMYGIRLRVFGLWTVVVP